MSTLLTGKVWELDIPQNEALVLMAYADQAHDDGASALPSRTLMAWMTGYSPMEISRVLKNPDKMVETVVGKLTEAAPKVFGGELDDKPAARILEERLQALPRPELVLMAALLLGAPLGAWLEAMREEGGGGSSAHA